MINPAVTDEALARSLGLYAGMVHHVLTDPGRWLGVEDEPDREPAGIPQRALDALKDRTLGKVTPASGDWAQQPLDDRVDWWVNRIAFGAGLAAATPRLVGALSDRLPLQAALGASAGGLAVCAVAREHGVDDPTDWVPLLATVLFDRQLAPQPAAVPPPEEAEQQLTADPTESADRPSRVASLGRGAQHAARTLWRLASAFRGLQELLDHRPRGGFLARTLGKLPVVGLAGGWLDERGGIRKAAEETAQLLAAR